MGTLDLGTASTLCPKCKILSLAFTVIHSLEPCYLCNLKPVYLPDVLDLPVPPPPCGIPSVPCALGALSHVATSWCNALPFDLASSRDLLSIFKVRLKSFLFQLFLILYCVLCLMFRYM